ncbi:MAG: hypothetical protein ACSLEN_10495 [Candidatus Malihini olakiniferum]
MPRSAYLLVLHTSQDAPSLHPVGNYKRFPYRQSASDKECLCTLLI